MAGPVFLRGGQKAWIVVFTCAVYRAIHLELVTSLSADVFMQALRRFIARRGRILSIFCDNGSNFAATARVLQELDWEEIQKESTVLRIKWKFNPPSSPWWTGFVERLVGSTKTILRKVLGRASLTYEELVTVLCDCEGVINSRPLTYVSDDASELVPLTPAHFIQGIPCTDVLDLDLVDSRHPVKRFRYLQEVRDSLRRRFRDEYLSELVTTSRSHCPTGAVSSRRRGHGGSR